MAAVVVEKCRGRGKETEEHIESLIARKVPPRVGPISDDFRCDSCLLNLSADFPEGSGLASTIPLPSAGCHWPSVIAADGVGTFCWPSKGFDVSISRVIVDTGF